MLANVCDVLLMGMGILTAVRHHENSDLSLTLYNDDDAEPAADDNGDHNGNDIDIRCAVSSTRPTLLTTWVDQVQLRRN